MSNYRYFYTQNSSFPGMNMAGMHQCDGTVSAAELNQEAAQNAANGMSQMAGEMGEAGMAQTAGGMGEAGMAQTAGGMGEAGMAQAAGEMGGAGTDQAAVGMTQAEPEQPFGVPGRPATGMTQPQQPAPEQPYGVPGMTPPQQPAPEQPFGVPGMTPPESEQPYGVPGRPAQPQPEQPYGVPGRPATGMTWPGWQWPGNVNPQVIWDWTLPGATVPVPPAGWSPQWVTPPCAGNEIECKRRLLQNCMYGLVYITARDGETYWFYPVSIDDRTVSGYRWSWQNGWFYYMFNLADMQNAFCYNS